MQHRLFQNLTDHAVMKHFLGEHVDINIARGSDQMATARCRALTITRSQACTECKSGHTRFRASSVRESKAKLKKCVQRPEALVRTEPRHLHTSVLQITPRSNKSLYASLLSNRVLKVYGGVCYSEGRRMQALPIAFGSLVALWLGY